MDRSGCGRTRPWLNLRYCPCVYLKRLEKTIKNTVRVAGVPAEIRTTQFSNTIQRRYGLGQFTWFQFSKEKEGEERVGGGWGLGKDVTLQGMGEHGNISSLEDPHAASACPSGESMLKRG
jgi:hypothetical protein